MSKDETLLWSVCYVDVGVVIATKWRHWLFYLQPFFSALRRFFFQNCSRELVPTIAASLLLIYTLLGELISLFGPNGYVPLKRDLERKYPSWPSQFFFPWSYWSLDRERWKGSLAVVVHLCPHLRIAVNLFSINDPRPQGFSLKKWVGLFPPHPFCKGKALGKRLRWTSKAHFTR